jgi:exosortase E/protease (VPEID-CTERM system)
LGGLAILLIEVWVLRGCLGPLDPPGLESWRARLSNLSWVFTRPILVVAVTALLIVAAWSRVWPRRSAVEDGGVRHIGFALIAHLIAIGGFAVLTGFLRANEGEPSPGAGIATVAWASSGLSAMGFLAVVSLADGAARMRAWHGSVVLALGSAAGVAAAVIGRFSSGFWYPLSRSTLGVVHLLLSLIYSDLVYLPADLIVGTPSYVVRIESECSGYEGIGLILTFLAVYLWFFRSDYRFPRALLLLPLGAVAMWLANAVRITLLVSLGTSVSPTIAESGFHSHAGWLALIGIGLGLVFATRRMRFFTNDRLDAGGTWIRNPAVPYLAPMVTILAVSFLTGSFASGFDRLYPVRVLATAGVLCAFRRDHAAVRQAWSWPAVLIGGGTFLLWMALEQATTHDHTKGAALSAGLAILSPAEATVWLTFRVVGSVITVPLAEELAFRGYLTRRLIADDFERIPIGRFTWPSFLISSIMFGALHGRWVAGTLAGMLYALALYRRGEIADAVLAHAVTNALIAIYVLVTASCWLWG